VPPKKKPRVIDFTEVEKKIAEYKEHVEHDRRYRTVVKELEQARHAIRRGFDRLLEAVTRKPATVKRTKKRAARKVTGRKSARKALPRSRVKRQRPKA
jgi:hypothetical protein